MSPNFIKNLSLIMKLTEIINIIENKNYRINNKNRKLKYLFLYYYKRFLKNSNLLSNQI